MRYLFSLFPGEVGTGKTTLLHHWIRKHTERGGYAVYNTPYPDDLDRLSLVGTRVFIAHTHDEVFEIAGSLNNVLIGLDEGHWIVSDKMYRKRFLEIATGRRHMQVCMGIATQKAQLVPADIRDMIDWCFIFRLHGRALVWVDDTFSFSDPDLHLKHAEIKDQDRVRRFQQRQMVRQIATLPDFQFIKYSIRRNKAIAKGVIHLEKEPTEEALEQQGRPTADGPGARGAGEREGIEEPIRRVSSRQSDVEDEP